MDADADGPKEPTMSSELIKHVTDASFESDVLQSDKPVLVDYWAEWCGPCKMIAPILDELSTQYDGRLQIAKMNVDENQDVPGRFGVMSIPTFLVVKGGKVLTQFVGARSEGDMQQAIDAAQAA